MRPYLLAASLLAALPASALDLTLPGPSQLAHEESEDATSYSLPVSPWLGSEGAELLSLQGALERWVWQVEGFEGSASELMSQIRGQLEAEAFEPVFACDTTLCGGFDFRFAMDVTPEPAMHVDLGDFSYLVMRRAGGTGVEHLALLTSRGGDRGYLHLVRISPAVLPPVEIEASTRSPDEGDAPEDIAASLDAFGSAILADLNFATGSSALEHQDYESLLALASYLAEHPGVQIALVGHTDAEGSLDSNIALSRARAEAVREALIQTYGIEALRLEAEGVGYLAPLTENDSQEGREQNRRVEVVITNTR